MDAKADERGKPISVALFVKEFPPDVVGGLETQAYGIARELERKSKYDVTVYTRTYSRDVPLDIDFDIARIPHWTYTRLGRGLTFKIMSLLSLLRDHGEFDVFHFMHTHPAYVIIGYLVHKLTGIPLCVRIAGGGFYYGKESRIGRAVIDEVFSESSVMVMADKVRRDVLAEFPDADVHIIGKGVDIPDRTAKGDSIVYIGRLVESKGVDRLIKSMARMDEHLLVVGDGPKQNELKYLADTLQVNAEFVGKVPPKEVNQYLYQSKFLVLPSLHAEGGMPSVMLEAMAVGLPVIITETGGIVDADETELGIRDGETGYIVPPDDIDALRKKIEYLCTHEEHRATLGQNARQYVLNNHSWETTIDRVIAVYRSLLESVDTDW